MWTATGGYYNIGTLTDGVTTDTPLYDPTPEDIQNWTYLAGITGNPSSMTWSSIRLAEDNIGGFTGVCFDTQDTWDTPGVWFEGTAHTAAALYARNEPGDAAAATAYINDIEYAQLNGANSNGMGIIAASVNGLNADGSPTYWPALHIGATGWFCLAALEGTPFKFCP